MAIGITTNLLQEFEKLYVVWYECAKVFIKDGSLRYRSTIPVIERGFIPMTETVIEEQLKKKLKNGVLPESSSIYIYIDTAG